jgi:SAM-dependent methyltransferase
MSVLPKIRLRREGVTLRECPVCDAIMPQRVAWRKWGYPVLRCACGLGATDAAGFDPNSYYTADYFNGGRRDGYGDYTASASVLHAEFRGVLNDLRTAGCRGGRLLEVGCAYGYFLDVARDAGFNCHGVELCAEAVAAAKGRGHAVVEGVLTEDVVRRHGPFDAVAMLDVIEHLPDPAGMLELLGKAVQPGGHIVITTGNWNSALSRVMGSRWRLMTPPQHLFFYTPDTLKKLLSNHGFDTINIRSPWKRVPLGLVAYQLTRRLGLRLPLPGFVHRAGVPLNLFDAMRVIARRRPT